jgi:hypothetical protein
MSVPSVCGQANIAANRDQLFSCKVEGAAEARRIKKQPVYMENSCENVTDFVGVTD